MVELTATLTTAECQGLESLWLSSGLPASPLLRITTDGDLMLVAHTTRPIAIPRVAGNHIGYDPVRARELSASTILVAAVGEVDAASAANLSADIVRHLNGYRQLVLDLSRLVFFAAAGYSVLLGVHSRCARLGVEWVLVPGPEVERLLRICDPDGILPTAPNIVSAVATLARSHTSRVS